MPDDSHAFLSDRVTELERRIRRLRAVALIVLMVAVSLSATALFGAGHAAGPRGERFDEITVGRINIVGPNGTNRMVLAHELPEAPFQGETLERTVPPGMAGIIFCAPNGDEVGGIGASGTDRFGHALFAIDYRGAPLEAIGFGSRFSPQGQSAGLMIMEPPTEPVDVNRLAARDEEEIARLQSMMVERVMLGVENFDAGLVIKDREGRDRIVLSVDAENTPIVMILDEDGQEVARLGAP